MSREAGARRLDVADLVAVEREPPLERHVRLPPALASPFEDLTLHGGQRLEPLDDGQHQRRQVAIAAEIRELVALAVALEMLAVERAASVRQHDRNVLLALVAQVVLWRHTALWRGGGQLGDGVGEFPCPREECDRVLHETAPHEQTRRGSEGERVL